MVRISVIDKDEIAKKVSIIGIIIAIVFFGVKAIQNSGKVDINEATASGIAATQKVKAQKLKEYIGKVIPRNSFSYGRREL